MAWAAREVHWNLVYGLQLLKAEVGCITLHSGPRVYLKLIADIHNWIQSGNSKVFGLTDTGVADLSLNATFGTYLLCYV